MIEHGRRINRIFLSSCRTADSTCLLVLPSAFAVPFNFSSDQATDMKMTLEAYLRAGLSGFPKDGIEGAASEWMPVAELSVTHGCLWAGDPCVCDGEDGCMIDVPNGHYIVEAQGCDFDGIRIIGRARARLSSASDVSVGEEIGITGTDSAMIAICDMGAVNAAVAGDDTGFQNVIDGYDFQRFGMIQFEMNGQIRIPYVNSGFGDGSGPMFRLMAGDDCVGIELDFICQEPDQ